MEWCGECDLGEAGGVGDLGLDGVLGDGGEIAQEGGKAVRVEPVGGPFGEIFGDGGVRSLSRCDDRVAFGIGGGFVVVVKENWGQSFAQMEFDVVGKHAEQNVGPDPLG